jgi:hypothetical protein
MAAGISLNRRIVRLQLSPANDLLVSITQPSGGQGSIIDSLDPRQNDHDLAIARLSVEVVPQAILN